MAAAYRVSPEVAGGFGEGTSLDYSGDPVRVDRLHYVFSGWLGDEIVESFPCFLVSERLAEAMVVGGLTGVELRDVEVSIDAQFERSHPDAAAAMPSWLWLYPVGSPFSDDMWTDERSQLHVSQHGYDVLTRFKVAAAEFVEVVGP